MRGNTFEVISVAYEPVKGGDRIILGGIVSPSSKSENWQFFPIVGIPYIKRILGTLGPSVAGSVEVLLEILEDKIKEPGDPMRWVPGAVPGLSLENCRIIEAENQAKAADIFRDTYSLIGRGQS